MQRLLTGIVIGAGWLLLLLYAPPSLFWLVMTLLAAYALHEYGAMLLTRDGEPALRPLFILLALLPILAAVSLEPALIGAAVMAALAGLLLLTIFRHGRLADPSGFLLRGAFAVFYPVLLLVHFPLLLALPAGRDWLIIAALIAVAADSGAYYAGRALGRHKLCPSLSPGKTVEGMVGGVGAGLALTALAVWFFFPAINLLHSLALAFILALASVVGDLAESLLKRGAGVKDSGALLPGHGGLLDRIDSLLLVVPLLYYLLILLPL